MAQVLRRISEGKIKAKHIRQLVSQNRYEDIVWCFIKMDCQSWVSVIRNLEEEQVVVLELLYPTALSMHRSGILDTAKTGIVLSVYTNYAISLDSKDGEVAQMILNLTGTWAA